jgi:hypothetical protein
LTGNGIRITPVRSRRDIETFLDIPYLVYRGNSNWAPPLRHEVRKLLSVRHNPFFDHGIANFWIAWRGRDPVGRISAQINHLHLDTYKDATGNFGLVEAIDDPNVFAALLSTAEEWLRDRGMRRILGPYSLSINDEIGVLIKGFDMPPMVMMPYSARYYATRLEECGYLKAKDLHAYVMDLRSMSASEIQRLEMAAARLRGEGKIRVRPIDMRRFADEIRLAIDIYNDGWQDNWGFLPVTPREVDYLTAAIRPIAISEAVLFAEVDGKPEAMMVWIPDVNEMIADLGGRLLPFGWIRLLWRIRKLNIKSGRMILGGVRRARRDSLMSGALITMMLAELTKAGLARGIEKVEFSWILEDNSASLAVSRYGNARLAKLYRIYEKSLMVS